MSGLRIRAGGQIRICFLLALAAVLVPGCGGGDDAHPAPKPRQDEVGMMPRVEGLGYHEATQRIKAAAPAGTNLFVLANYSKSGREPGVVIDQDPAAGEPFGGPASINLELSGGATGRQRVQRP